MQRNIKKPANVSGFSLIEIMAVLLIVSFGLLGVANLMVQSMQAQTINRGSIVAYQLAQEGIEMVRQVRDTNWMQGEDWLEGMGSGTYCLDYRKPILSPVASLNACPLYLDSQGWYYADTSGAASLPAPKFKRVVEIAAATSSAAVKAIISWNDRGKIFRYEAETMLYDWR